MVELERKSIIELDYSPLFMGGAEGSMNRVKDGKIFKEFYNDVSLVTRNRKVKKLNYLCSCKELEEYYPKIYYIVMDILFKNPRGYVMDFITATNFEGVNFTQQEMIEILKKLKKIIFQKFYTEHGISYLDLRKPNLRVDENNNPVLLDMDGIKTEEEALDVTPNALKSYYIRGGSSDKHALIMMFNDLTKEFLQYEHYEMDKEGEAFTQTNDIYLPDSIYDHEFMFEHIKNFCGRNSIVEGLKRQAHPYIKTPISIKKT